MTDTTSTRPQMGDEVRAEFEAWVKAERKLEPDSYQIERQGDGYYHDWTDAAWDGWKAARASLPQPPAHDEGHPHLIGGEFQSDKYPTTPRGKVPLSVKDKTAQDLLWTYAQRRRAVDGEFANDLELALTKHGFSPSTPAQSVLMDALHKISNPFDHGHCGTCGKECAGATDCDCSFPVWEQDNPIAIAKDALSQATEEGK